MSYEIPLPMPEKLQEKPILNATELHKYLESAGFKPLVVVVDNANAKIRVYFERSLSDTEAKKLLEVILDYYKKHIKVKVE